MTTPLLIAHRFRIADPEHDLLGQGGMGAVYRALDALTGETVAVKVLNPENVSPELLDRFQREGEALRQLNHPNIVHLVAVVEEHGQHYLVMEYVPGGSLEDLLAKQGRLPYTQVAEIALDLADALTRAHRLGILHRDIKPANVLLAADGTPRLADFGIAYRQSAPHLTQTGVLVGTVDYLSPEACQGEPPGERSDIWSFGVLLFQLLSGRLPFDGPNLTARLTAILTQPVPEIARLVPDLPDALADLVYRMLEKDPQQRIPSVRLVGAELEAILHGRASPTPGLRPPTPAAGAPLEPHFTAATPAPDRPKHNLPVQATPFVGREGELCELARLLSEPGVRLVTVLGVGGIGKTRLAIEAGARQLDRFEHGVYFVALAGIEAVEAIVPATAQALGFSFYEGREPRLQLLDYLHAKKLLLIFDNFEHLPGGASLVNDILQSASGVLVLCTSRTRLGLAEEHLFHLAGMDFPDWETPADALEYSAVKLFLQSARRARPGFELAAGDLQYVARICRLVGGMPLGILLAAAWLEMLTPAEVAAEIQQGLDFLTTDLGAIPERQRSLRAVLDYSWNSLTESEQAVFCGLSVFRGGFTRAAAQQVTGAALRDLMGLVNKSLLTRRPAGRYDLHELLHQYAAEKLAGDPQARLIAQDRHCACYAEFLRQREPGLYGKDQLVLFAEIEAEIDNLRAGWEWAVDRLQIDWIADYLECLGELFSKRGWSQDGAGLFARAAHKLSNRTENDRAARLLQGRLCLWQGRLGSDFDSTEHIGQFFQTALAIFRELGEQQGAAYALCYDVLYIRMESKELLCQESLDSFQALGDLRGQALALRGLAYAALDQGNYPLAKPRFQDSLALFEKLSDQQEIARALDGLGYICWIMGDYQAAARHHEQALALCKQTGHQGDIAEALGSLAIDAYGLRDYPRSRALFLEGLKIDLDIGNSWGAAGRLGDLGELSLAMGEYAQAADYARECNAIYARVGRGETSWSLRICGEAASALGDFATARVYLHQSLVAAQKISRLGHALLSLVGVAELFAKLGKTARAYELLALVISHPSSWQMAKEKVAPLLVGLEARIPPGAAAEARQRGRTSDLKTTVQEVLEELQG